MHTRISALVFLSLATAAPASAQLWSQRCLHSIRDQANPSVCLLASSNPTLGMLYPLSFDFNVDAYGNIASGKIGPYNLNNETENRIFTIDVGATSMFGGDPIIELARFSSTDGVGVGNIEFINSHNTSDKMIALISAGNVGGSTDKGGLIQFFTKGDGSGQGVVSRMIILDDGKVGIGTQTPSERLHVNGNILATGSITEFSDHRFKTNVVDLEDALAKVLKLRGVEFDWRTDEFPEHGFSDARQIGFIAQELAEVVPEVVFEGSDGTLSVDYAKLTPLLVEAIRTQAAELAELRDANDELGRKVARLDGVEAQLQRIEGTLAALAGAAK